MLYHLMMDRPMTSSSAHLFQLDFFFHTCFAYTHWVRLLSSVLYIVVVLLKEQQKKRISTQLILWWWWSLEVCTYAHTTLIWWSSHITLRNAVKKTKITTFKTFSKWWISKKKVEKNSNYWRTVMCHQMKHKKTG